MVDEVHERSLDSDFLLIVLREALAANPNLRVVLMSATLDASLFSRYFGGCATIDIPGALFIFSSSSNSSSSSSSSINEGFV